MITKSPGLDYNKTLTLTSDSHEEEETRGEARRQQALLCGQAADKQQKYSTLTQSAHESQNIKQMHSCSHVVWTLISYISTASANRRQDTCSSDNKKLNINTIFSVLIITRPSTSIIQHEVRCDAWYILI